MKSKIGEGYFKSTTKMVNSNTKILFTLYGEVLNIKCYFDPHLNGDNLDDEDNNIYNISYRHS
jgi:hypothetical protein